MKFSIFIHPPRPKPRRVTTWPSPSTICDPCVVRMFVDIENLSCVITCNEEELSLLLHRRYHPSIYRPPPRDAPLCFSHGDESGVPYWRQGQRGDRSGHPTLDKHREPVG